MRHLLGTIINGSLYEGFVMRVVPEADLEHIKTGKFVCIVGKQYTFFSLITDLALHVTHNDILLFPPDEHEHLLKKILHKKDIYATAHVKPMLMMNEHHEIMPVKTIPHHFAHVFEAQAEDVSRIFGDQHDSSNKFFHIGSPLDMQAPVCLDLEKMTERSNGIFGKTGTGKTFITRLLLAGFIKQHKAVNLIFDMHSEYGLQARKEGNKSFVKGLKTLFGSKVAIFSLDPTSTRRRGGTPDVDIYINLDSIRVEDILALQYELNLPSTAIEVAHLLAAKYKHRWLSALLSQDIDLKEFAQQIGAHCESIAALYRKLKRIERFSFITTQGQSPAPSVIDQMMAYLQKGISIIIEFGNYNSSLCYLLIANIITRRIHQEYITQTERFLYSQQAQDEPKKLMITIEEAHKFLNLQAARQTIFGIIAREMRKYYVSLLVVDQRPSGIDPEVMSQIGTKLVAQLNDERDIAAVMTGVSNAMQLRSVLSSLASKKQILVLGHAVTMPVVIEAREYNEDFYRAMLPKINTEQIDRYIQELS